MTKTTPHLTRAMQEVLSAMARAANAPLQTLSPADARIAYEAGTEVLEVPRLELNGVTNCVVPTRDGQHIKARLYRPASGLLPALMYLHGGGFVIGNIDTHDLLCRQLSHLAGCAVLSVDYRLAPEHRFPTAAHDAWDALQWLRANAETLQIDASRMAVGGDSAGGNLAAVCAVWARDAGLPLALQMLFYPCCAPHQDTPSHRRFSKGFVLEKDQLDWFFGHYLRTPADREDWRFAPLLAPDVDGVAPAWIGLAELDPLVDEGVMYGDKLRASSVHVDLEIYRGVTHEFIKMGRVIPEAKVAHAHAAQALRRVFSV
jgi:acetyl esterase